MKNNIFLLLAIWAPVLNAQNFDNGFDFNLPFDDTVTVEYLPKFPGKPITDGDRVRTDSAGNFIVNGKPYRFYGGNLTTHAAFPLKDEAAVIAGRMRKYGINLVRFHHIDNPWSEGSLFHQINGTRAFNTALLDRLDYFIYQLKQHGIYVNMNLNVSRTFEESDGVLYADSLSDYGKGITQFDPTMIALQKEYASMLMDHVNPYTGTTLATDPVLAMVEIINENSLFRMWYSGSLKPISEGGKLPVHYNNQFDSLWHDFLVEKYDSTKYLEMAWNQNRFEGDTLFMDGFEDGIGDEWQLELHNTAAATMQVTPDAATGESAVHVNITSLSAETWHTQFKYVGGTIKKESVYEVIFKARANETKGISMSVMRDNSPWTYYTGQNFLIDTTWQEFIVSFKAPEDNTGFLRIGFSFQHNLGDFYFDDFLLKTESNSGLLDGESLEERTVGRLGSADFMSFTRERVMDQTEFHADVQIRFLDIMGTFLSDTLGVTAPMTGTNWFTGPEDVYVQNTLDYVDNHSYWDHPQFPNQPWSPTDWNIKNIPMMTSGEGTIENLFNGLIIKGKPYTVSEYNHAFPNQYQSELLPILTSYLSFNDADGFMVFTYSSSWNWDEDKVSGYFDIHRNSSLMGSYPLFSYAFRNYLIDASSETTELAYSRDDILSMPLGIENPWSAHYPYSKQLGYAYRLEMSVDHETDFDFSTLPPEPVSPYSLNNGQIHWDKGGLFMINTAQFASICGTLDTHAGAATDMMQLGSGSDFGSVSWLSLSDSALDQSSRSILAIGTKMMNTGMIWDGTTTIHDNWGGAPALVYPLQLDLKLKTQFSHMRISPLDEYGLVIAGSSEPIAADSTTGLVSVTLDQAADRTLWYGIEALDYTEPEVPVDTVDTTTIVINKLTPETVRSYPNPARDVVHFEMEDPGRHDAILRIFDLTGNLIYSNRIWDMLKISTSGMSPGTYYYQLQDQEGLFTGKFILLE